MLSPEGASWVQRGVFSPALNPAPRAAPRAHRLPYTSCNGDICTATLAEHEHL
jgi:hypothetical protein